ncbi:MAG TPA: Fur family transcriptional regulator [Methylomirabilota bacterium]|nr:Fur family transcriptional regulator [Methylomirabilota bacterium]
MDRITLAAADRLTAAGERVTRQRLLVANALAAAGRQLTADQLYRSLRRREPAIGRATVFRTLETLVDAGVARRLELEGHVYAYVACLPAHHHHIACTSCGRVEEIDEAYVTPIARRLAREMGFEIDDARLDFYGRCATCRAQDAASA